MKTTMLASEEAHAQVSALSDAVVDARTASILPQTLASVVELSALRAHSILEEFLRALFYDSMLGDTEGVGAKSRFTLSNKDELDLLLYNTGSRREKYLDWLPFDIALGRAEAYLINGSPFTRIKYRQVELRALEDLALIRNAVAHPGDFAAERFKKLVVSKNYQANSPAEYLLSIRSGEIEILHLLARFQLLITGLTAESDAAANAVLEPERLFEAEKKAPPGEFACSACDALQSVLNDGDPLMACVHCLVAKRCDNCGQSTRTSPRWIRQFA